MGTCRSRGGPTDGDAIRRWECHCREPAFLLGTFDRNGRINIKVRDRYWHVVGLVRTTCPLCGIEHEIDSRRAGDPVEIGGVTAIATS